MTKNKPSQNDSKNKESSLGGKIFSLISVLIILGLFCLYFLVVRNAQSLKERFYQVDALPHNSSLLLQNTQQLNESLSNAERNMALENLDKLTKYFELSVNSLEGSSDENKFDFAKKYVPSLKVDFAKEYEAFLERWSKFLTTREEYSNESSERETVDYIYAAENLHQGVREFTQVRKRALENQIGFHDLVKFYLFAALSLFTLMLIGLYLLKILKKKKGRAEGKDDMEQREVIKRAGIADNTLDKIEATPENKVEPNNTEGSMDLGVRDDAFKALFNRGNQKNCITDTSGTIIQANQEFTDLFGEDLVGRHTLFQCFETEISKKKQSKLFNYIQLFGMKSVDKESLTRLNPLPQLRLKSNKASYDLNVDYYKEMGQGRILLSLNEEVTPNMVNQVTAEPKPSAKFSPFSKVLEIKETSSVSEPLVVKTPLVEKKIQKFAQQIEVPCIVKTELLELHHVNQSAERKIKDSLVHMASLCLSYFTEGESSRLEKGKLPLPELLISAASLDKDNSFIPGEEWIHYSYQDDGIGVDRELVIAAAVECQILDPNNTDSLEPSDILDLLMDERLRLSPNDNNVPQNLSFIKKTVVNSLKGKIKISYIQNKETRLDILIPKANILEK